MKTSHITFGNRIETKVDGNVFTKREYNKNNVLLVLKEKEISTDRFLKREDYDLTGKLISKQEFEYLPNKVIEKFWCQSYSYVRTSITKIENSFKYSIEEYISSNPEKNYIREIVRTLQDKLVHIIQNGEKII